MAFKQTGAQLDIQLFSRPPKHYTQPWKNYQFRIFGVKFLYSGKFRIFGGKFLYSGKFFSVWEKCVWAKSKNFRGTNFIWGAIFSFGKFYLGGFIQFWEILKLCFKGKFGLEGFIQFGQIGVWEATWLGDGQGWQEALLPGRHAVRYGHNLPDYCSEGWCRD